MSRITRNHIPLLALLLLGAVVSTWPSPREAYAQPGQSGPVRVTVVNPVPLPVMGQVGTTGTPFQIVLCAAGSFSGGSHPDCLGNEASMTLPPDQRAIIELVSAGCRHSNVSSLEISLGTQVSDVTVAYPVHLEFEALSISKLVGALQGRIYADPGSTIGMNFVAGSASSDPGSVRCDVAISGLLIAM